MEIDLDIVLRMLNSLFLDLERWSKLTVARINFEIVSNGHGRSYVELYRSAHYWTCLVNGLKQVVFVSAHMRT